MYSNFEAALQSLEFVAALNKRKMIEWLATLHIDYETIPIRSFVHQQFEFCVAIYELLCKRLDCDPKVLFTSRRWFHRDTQNCEHGLVRCLCLECVSIHAKKSKCDVAGCDKQPTFNFPNVRPAIKCGAHKEEGMVDVTNANCDVAGCDKRPTFNFPNVRPAIKCGAHKEEGMVGVNHAKK